MDNDVWRIEQVGSEILNALRSETDSHLNLGKSKYIMHCFCDENEAQKSLRCGNGHHVNRIYRRDF
jgi:hypothetical protein